MIGVCRSERGGSGMAMVVGEAQGNDVKRCTVTGVAWSDRGSGRIEGEFDCVCVRQSIGGMAELNGGCWNRLPISPGLMTPNSQRCG